MIMNFIDTFFPDHFSQKDRLGVAAGVALSLLALVALVRIKPPTKNRTQPPIAKLEAHSNSVRYKESGSVSFYDVSSSEKLQNKDEVFTGENSNALVRFIKSGTLLKIPSSSLIRVEESDGGDSIEVHEGVVDIVIKKNQMVNIKSHGTIHQIKSSQSDSVVKAFYSAGELHLFTKDKGVKVKSEKGDMELPSDSDAKLIDGLVKNDTSFKLISPTPGENLESTGAIKIATNQKAKYNVTISKNVDFSRPYYSTKFDGVNLDWDSVLEEGDYFLKVENKNDQQIVPVSLTSKFRIDGLVPSDGELLNLNPGDKTTFRWNPLPVSSYRVMIRDSFGHDNVYTTSTNFLVVENLKGPEIEWSVLPEISPGKYSNIKKIALAGLKFRGKIQFTQLPTTTKFKQSETKTLFSWSALNGERVLVRVWDNKNNLELFTKQVSESSLLIPMDSSGARKLEIDSLDYPGQQKAEFNYEVYSPVLTWDSKMPNEIRSTEESIETPIRSKDHFNERDNTVVLIKYSPVSGPQTTRQLPLNNIDLIKLEGFGTHCFTAQLLIAKESIGKSDDYCIKFIQTPVFAPLPRASDSVLTYIKHNGLDSYKIEVPKIEKAVKYQFDIYSDNFNKNLVYTVNSTKPEIYWATNRSGIYYLKYKVFDVKNRKSDYSPFSKLIFPISPLSDW